MINPLSIPTWADHASSPDHSQYPELWDEIVGYWAPPLGKTGGTLFNLAYPVETSGFTDFNSKRGNFYGIPIYAVSRPGTVLNFVTNDQQWPNDTFTLDTTDPFSVLLYNKVNVQAISFPAPLMFLINEPGTKPFEVFYQNGGSYGTVSFGIGGQIQRRLEDDKLSVSSASGFHSLIFVFKGGSLSDPDRWKVFLNGAPATHSSSSSFATRFNQGTYLAPTDLDFRGEIAAIGAWQRGLTDYEALILGQDPLALLRPKRPLVVGLRNTRLSPAVNMSGVASLTANAVKINARGQMKIQSRFTGSVDLGIGPRMAGLADNAVLKTPFVNNAVSGYPLVHVYYKITTGSQPVDGRNIKFYLLTGDQFEQRTVTGVGYTSGLNTPPFVISTVGPSGVGSCV